MKVSLKCTSRKYKFGEKPVQECNKVATKCEMPIFVFFLQLDRDRQLYCGISGMLIT